MRKLVIFCGLLFSSVAWCEQSATTTVTTGTGSNVSGWAAIAIAALALLATCWQAIEARKQAKLNREHNKISMLPMLVHHENWNLHPDGLMFDLIIRNVGPGVALIKDRYFTYENNRFTPKEQGRAAQELCSLLFQQIIPYKIISTGMFGKTAKIPPGASITLVQILFQNPHQELRGVVEELASKASFEVEYKSVYKDSFRFSTDD